MAGEGGPHGGPMVHVRATEIMLSLEEEPAEGDTHAWTMFEGHAVVLTYWGGDHYAVQRGRWWLTLAGRWVRHPGRNDPDYEQFKASTRWPHPDALNVAHAVLRGEFDNAPKVQPPAAERTRPGDLLG